MRRTTSEERDLFLAALSGRLPAKRVRAAAKPASHQVAEAKADILAREPKDHVPGRRRATDDECELFLVAIGLRTPVKPRSKPAPPSAATVKAKVSVPGGGLDGNTRRRLERGEIAPTAKLDLHGLTEAGAHGALMAFLLAAHRRGDRLVLVVTGKGSAAKESGSGVLRQMVPRWLDEAPMARIIAEKRWAHRRHGGEGALYVYFRKR